MRLIRKNRNNFRMFQQTIGKKKVLNVVIDGQKEIIWGGGGLQGFCCVVERNYPKEERDVTNQKNSKHNKDFFHTFLQVRQILVWNSPTVYFLFLFFLYIYWHFQ